jgi:RNA polymerase sigma-70 factor (ECF subfamily)
MGYGDDLREPCGLTYAQLSKLSDNDVMAHLAAGHGDAIAILLDRYSRLVLSIASKIVHDSSEAEDVAQEVFVYLCRTAGQFDAVKGSTKMWIVRTAYRRSLNRRRYLSLRDAHLLGDNEEFLNLPSASDYSSSPRLSAYESQRLVRQILGHLDGAQRRVLEMVFFDGLSMREVAAQTGTTLESVRHRYYRGIDKLRRMTDASASRAVVARPQESRDAKA